MSINQIMESTTNFTKPLASTPTNTHRPSQTATSNVQNVKTLSTSVSQQNIKSTSDEEIQQAVDKIQNFTDKTTKSLKFSVDEDTGKTVVKVLDSQTMEIIRQFPSEEAISIARTLDKMQGLLFSDKA
ncbi:MAG: flagellar protein FlaG [Nitrosomonas sp.]|nr:flagellar protein FlaG [Nitrosomonas sp.]